MLSTEISNHFLITCSKICQPQLNYSSFLAGHGALWLPSPLAGGNQPQLWEHSRDTYSPTQRWQRHGTTPRYTTKATLYLLHLKLDGRFDLIHLGHQVLVVGEQRREFPGFVQARAQDSRNLFDQGLRSQEGIVLLSCKESIREVRRDSAPTPSSQRRTRLRTRNSTATRR